jgi:hypothetical protein
MALHEEVPLKRLRSFECAPEGYCRTLSLSLLFPGQEVRSWLFHFSTHTLGILHAYHGPKQGVHAEVSILFYSGFQLIR